MHARQSERQNRSGDRVDFFSGGKWENSRNLELIGINFGNSDFTLGPIGDVLIPVGKLKGKAIISRGKRQHALVGKEFILNILVAILVDDVVQILLSDENQFIGVAIENLHSNLKRIHQAVVLGGGDAQVTWRFESQGKIEAGNAVVIANRQEDDVQVMPLKNHAGADLLAVHPLAANVVPVAGLLRE